MSSFVALRPGVIAAAVAVAGLWSHAAHAVTWTDWTAATATTAQGTAGAVNVSFTSDAGLWNWQTDPGVDFYAPWPTGADTPSNTDILMFGGGGTRTIQFSQAVDSVTLALVSWNVPGNVTFSHPFSSAVVGCGYWGCGSITPGAGNLAFTASGEVHGTLTFNGPISTLVITDGTEYWHGLTVGIGAPIPEPATTALMVLGLLGVVASARRAATARR